MISRHPDLSGARCRSLISSVVPGSTTVAGAVIRQVKRAVGNPPSPRAAVRLPPSTVSARRAPDSLRESPWAAVRHWSEAVASRSSTRSPSWAVGISARSITWSIVTRSGDTSTAGVAVDGEVAERVRARRCRAQQRARRSPRGAPAAVRRRSRRHDRPPRSVRSVRPGRPATGSDRGRRPAPGGGGGRARPSCRGRPRSHRGAATACPRPCPAGWPAARTGGPRGR